MLATSVKVQHEIQRYSLKPLLKEEILGYKGNLCTRSIYVYCLLPSMLIMPSTTTLNFAAFFCFPDFAISIRAIRSAWGKIAVF